ncbi:peptidoglycan-binding protein [Streptomyces sp. NBC_00237]|uniref:peptidoglycan-binding protein n=1 Tax=Streptomyces sp. NBC_00237 TaxID=2975687 RepID=UPI0022552D40|nr:peptidoglycan-binding protein [Streptomyces sp. NBC_00237]MCX5201037.1 peptidoglycan-binding protein [Streptomyces sp. NBC_00237]
MPDLWMPGARRLDVGDTAPMDGGPAKAVAHITWDRNATAAKPQPLVSFETLTEYFGRNPDGRRAAPHILWDPFTGRFTQFVPADSRSKSLADRAGGTRTNRAGKVVLQIEALFFPYCRVDGKVYGRLVDTPCKGWLELLAWVRSHGVPDVWPMGRPSDFASRRDEATWAKQGGWYGHSQVPENDHQDPGSWPAFAPAPPRPAYEPFPGAAFFVLGRRSAVITAMGRRLVAEGCGRYQVGPGPAWSEADRQSYAAWQRRLGYSGDSADGIPGAESWARLRVPNV